MYLHRKNTPSSHQTNKKYTKKDKMRGAEKNEPNHYWQQANSPEKQVKDNNVYILIKIKHCKVTLKRRQEVKIPPNHEFWLLHDPIFSTMYYI